MTEMLHNRMQSKYVDKVTKLRNIILGGPEEYNDRRKL